jgi:hypothetical protein
MTLPFTEEQIGENLFIRTFKQEIDSGELILGISNLLKTPR